MATISPFHPMRPFRFPWKLFAGCAVVGALVFLAVVVWWALARPYKTYYINGGSMSPTLIDGDYVFVRRVAAGSWQPRRGALVTYLLPGDPRYTYLHRVVGLGGETFEVQDGQVLINGQPLDEPWLPPGAAQEEPRLTVPLVALPPDTVWVLGDHRISARDSRVHGGVPTTNVTGEVTFRYFAEDAQRIGRVR